MKPATLCVPALLAFFVPAHAHAQESPAPADDELTLHRLELRPLAGWAAIPSSVTAAFVGADVTYRMSRFFAVGTDGAWYGPFDRSAGPHPSYPLNETLWSADLDAIVVPWPARAGAGSASGALEAYALGGFGLLATRPLSVIDPADRSFTDNHLVNLDVGVGLRVFVGMREAITLEVRDLMYFEKVENEIVASGPAGSDARNPDTWYSDRSHFTNAIQVRLGASFFLFGG